MTLQKLASLIAKREGKKHQASIGDIREILKIVVQLQVEDMEQNPDLSNGPFECLSDEANKEIDKRKKKARAK